MEKFVNTRLEECRKKFNDLLDNLTKLLHGRREGDRRIINGLFDELNALDFKASFVTNPEKAVLLINQICFVVLPNDTFLVAKACQLINKLITQQNIKVEGKTLTLAVKWCCQSVKNCADLAIIDILKALEGLVRGNGHLIEKIHEIGGSNGVLMPLLKQQTSVNLKCQSKNVKLASSIEVQTYALCCLEGLAYRRAGATPADPALLDIWKTIFDGYLKMTNPYSNDRLYQEIILTVSFHGLRDILIQAPGYLKTCLGEMLGIIEKYLNYGLPSYSQELPKTLYPSLLPSPGIRMTSFSSDLSKSSKSVRLRNKYKKIDSNRLPTATCNDENMDQRSSNIPTSDSENSDSEVDVANRIDNMSKVVCISQTVRQAALTLLLKIVKILERNEIFQYWAWLLRSESLNKEYYALIGCICHDPSPKVRVEALNVLCILLSGSRTFLQHAENCDKNCAFIAFSVALGTAVREIHHSLCRILFYETSPFVITQLLRCLAILVQNTAYKRLAPGLITKVIRNARPYTEHEDWTVQVASFTLLGSIVAADAPLPETLSLLKRFSRVCDPLAENTPGYKERAKGNDRMEQEDEEEEEEEVEKEDEGESAKKEALGIDEKESDKKNISLQPYRPCWLLEACLKHLSSASTSISVIRVECLQVIRALALHYFEPLIAQQLPPLLTMLQYVIYDIDPTLRLHCGKVIEAIGEKLQHDGHKNTLTASLNFWQTLLPGPVTTLIQCSADATQRAVGCECLAALGEKVFQQLPRDQQILLIALLVGCCSDEESNVRAAAIQALAICSLYHNLREDIDFITDTCERVTTALEDNAFQVRMKASWSLGNITDALLLNMKDENIESVSDLIIMNLLNISITSAEDTKLRSNIMRALGNILHLLNGKQMQDPEFQNKTEQAIQILVKYATSGNYMKVRWNACYALGNMMQNSFVYQDKMRWPELVFPALIQLVQNCPNFKVRIAAAQALRTPSDRKLFVSYYLPTWSALLGAFEQTRAPHDVGEYAHHDTLLNHLCLALASLTAVAEPEDLIPMQDTIVAHLDIVKAAVARCHIQMLPENTGPLLSASTHATYLLQKSTLSSEQGSSATLLVNLFCLDATVSENASFNV